MQLSANRLEELKTEVLQRLERYPGLKEIYSNRWVEEQFRLGPTQGFHPAVRIVLGEALAAGIENAWLTVSAQRESGAIGSRLSWLAGSFRRSRQGKHREWQDIHREWWSAVAEVYLAAHLVKQGYNVQFQGEGSDLALYEKQSELVGHVEVHAPRQTLEHLEFDDRIFWALQGRIPPELRLTATPSWDQLALGGRCAAALAAQIAQLCETVGPNTVLPLRRRLAVTKRYLKGYLDVEIGPGGSGGSPYPRQAQYGGAALPAALVENIIERASGERKKGQLTDPDRWTVFAVEIAWYHARSLYLHVLDSTSVEAFPVEQLPKHMAALVLYAVDLARGESGPARAFLNPKSSRAGDPSLARLLGLLDRPLRRPRKKR